MGCRKERESIRGLWFPCLLLLSEFLPAVKSSETQLRPWGRSAVHLCSHLPKSQNAPSSAWLPKKCVSSGMLEPWHTQSWATPQPPASSPCCQKTHLPSSCTAKNHNGQCLPTIVGWMDVHRPFFYWRQLTDLSLAPLKDPEFVFESCEIAHLPKVPY